MNSPSSHEPPRAPHRDRDGEGAALLIVDMINGFDFPGAESVRSKAMAAARAIAKLRAAFDRFDLPVIYVNDNFGEWHSERSRLIERAHARAGGTIAETVAPEPNDYFIIKPQFSGFYATNLPVLLPKLGVRKLVLTGIQTDICILFTAADAHMRDYALWVPEDCVASEHDDRGAAALAIARDTMSAKTGRSEGGAMEEWLRLARENR